MGLFDVFNKSSKSEETVKTSKKGSKLFRTSKPYGYYIPDVDNAIEKYNETLSEMKAAIVNFQNKVNQLTSENENLKNELKKLHVEMSLMEVPEMSSAMEHTLLDGFEKITGKQRKKDEKEEKKTMKDFSDITFDSFIPDDGSNDSNSSNNGFNPFDIIQ